jgi:hypothetical protein
LKKSKMNSETLILDSEHSCEVYQLDPVNKIIRFRFNNTPSSPAESYWYKLDFMTLLSETTLAQPTRAIYGHRPKFLDFTFDNINAPTVPNSGYAHGPMTPRAEEFAKAIKDRLDWFHPNTCNNLYNANLVHYPDVIEGGPSGLGKHSDTGPSARGMHSDNPGVTIPIVTIYSRGQTRSLTIWRNKTGGGIQKVGKIPLVSNEIVAMIGDTFQQTYQHAVEKLPPAVEKSHRFSFNARFTN